ncbi:MAG: ATP-binding protein [Chlamydiales bacterium]|nr:ATP-binding protein [Chlamydiales bacterium]
MSANQFDEVYKEHKYELQHLDVAHKPYIITFSATPGMGKTTVAIKLEATLKAIRISSDTARTLLAKHGFKLASLSDYLLYVLKQLEQTSPNHLIILDISVDREYKLIADEAQKQHIPLFIIRLDVTKEEAAARILQSKPNPEAYLKHLDKWFQDYQSFNPNNVSFTLTQNNLPALIKTLQENTK